MYVNYLKLKATAVDNAKKSCRNTLQVLFVKNCKNEWNVMSGGGSDGYIDRWSA